MFELLVTYLKGLRPLRLILALLAVASMLLAPPAGTRIVMEGWPLYTTLIIPSLTPLIFFGLLLDALMGRVRLADSTGTEIRRYRSIVWTDLVLTAGLVIAWYPLMSSLGGI